MLAAARDALVHHGVIDPSEDLPPFHARFSSNLVLGMLVYPTSASFYVVKVAVEGELDREFRGLSAAHAAMPRNAPKAIGLTRHRSFPVLVSSGIRHEPLIPLGGRASLRSFESGMDVFFSVTARAFRTPPEQRAPDYLREALARAAGMTGWPGWRSYCDRIAPDVAALPSISQHGDLSANNIGLADRELIFFDWEDFGLIDLPGFDLAVLLLSLNMFDALRLVARLRSNSLERRLMQSGCSRLNMAPELFLLLFPAYLSLFAHMKSDLGYSPEVAARAMSALKSWLSTEYSPDVRSARGSTVETQ